MYPTYIKVTKQRKKWIWSYTTPRVVGYKLGEAESELEAYKLLAQALSTEVDLIRLEMDTTASLAKSLFEKLGIFKEENT